MDAMSKMMASMLGISPNEIAAMATRVQDGLLAMTEALKKIQDDQATILATLERIENDGGKDSRRGGRKPSSGIALTNGATD